MRSPRGTVYKQAVKGVNDLATLRPDVAKSWHPTKNLPLTPEDLSPGSSYKVWWVGAECNHDFWSSPMEMSSKRKATQKTVCSVCKGRQILIGFNDLATMFPDIVAELHPDKNGDVSPYEISHFSSKSLWWMCKEGHEWEMRVAARTKSGLGCIYCSGYSVLPGFNDFASTHPEMANDWHPEKNGALKPTHLTYGSNKRVWWMCKEGHEWSSMLGSRTVQNGNCPVCSGQMFLRGYNDLATTHPDLALEWHPTKNGTLLPSDVRSGGSKKVWWICSLGHSFHICPNERVSTGANRINKYSICSTCHNRTILAGFNDLATLRPSLANEWHPTKNGNLTPQMVSQTSGKRVWWLCKSNHEWESTVANRNAHDCPSCTLGNSSKIEQALYEEMKKLHPDALNGASLPVQWRKAKHSSVDIFIPSLSLIVEYDGKYWHRNKHAMDTQKTTALIAAGYKVIRVRAKPLEFLDMKDANLVQIVHNKETAGELADMVNQFLYG